MAVNWTSWYHSRGWGRHWRAECYGDANRKRRPIWAFTIASFRGEWEGAGAELLHVDAERPSEIGKQRLDLIEKIHNGFIPAKKTWTERSGEFFGTRQSGCRTLDGRLSDVELLELARSEATRLFQIDPNLGKLENRLLAAELARVWKQSATEWS